MTDCRLINLIASSGNHLSNSMVFSYLVAYQLLEYDPEQRKCDPFAAGGVQTRQASELGVLSFVISVWFRSSTLRNW